MNILEINQRKLSLLDVNQLKAFLDIFKGISNPKAKLVVKDLARELGTRKMEAVEEASVKDIIKSVKVAAKKIGGIIDKVFDDKGFQDAYAKYVDNPKDKNRLKKIQDYTNGMLGDMSEASDLEENIGVQDGRRVVVKALTKPAALRLKKKLRNKFSSWDTSIDKDGLSMIVPNEKPIIRYIQKQPEVDTIGEATDLEEAAKFWTVTITKKAGKLFKGQTVDVKARNSAEAIKKGIKQMKGNPMTVPSDSVDAVLGEAYDSDEKHTMDPKSHVELNKETGMYCVYNIKGKKVKEFESKEDAEEYAVKNHDALMKESVDLEEAALPFKELEKAWIRTKGNDKKREKLVKKHKLKPLISNVRQGSIKLGPMNDLKAKNGNHTMAGLDADGELIFISNNPVRIHYPSNIKDRPKGEEMKENTLQHQRLVRVVEVALGEKPDNTNEFIKESNIDLTMTPSSIQKAYKQFNIKK